ncbi:hypothetical protein ILUMI_25379 [Ignelater luminosus]|uniref:Uncharacterized protein n=1 Tax=Ignelater luminosus TaxID=2038154 RepID=A0A8K0C8N2_IGNLU|nr:hypothetical protein ILUMI_25379 [Ignelater luminosus]
MNLNATESNSEPFSARSSDDYEPESSDYSDSENKNYTTRRPNYKQNIVKNESVVPCKRKRKRNPEMRKRNIRKRKLASGEEHINTADKVVPARKTGPDLFSRFDIRHRHASFPITLPEAENKAYDGQFALQKLKYNDVMTLTSKYVSEDCMPYYQSLKK